MLRAAGVANVDAGSSKAKRRDGAEEAIFTIVIRFLLCLRYKDNLQQSMSRGIIISTLPLPRTLSTFLAATKGDV